MSKSICLSAEWYDRHAIVFDLEPGQMLNWPLNAPHRVENLNTCVNISMTVSYVNEDIRRAQMVHLANGLLRNTAWLSAEEPRHQGRLVLEQGGAAETTSRQLLGKEGTQRPTGHRLQAGCRNSPDTSWISRPDHALGNVPPRSSRCHRGDRPRRRFRSRSATTGDRRRGAPCSPKGAHCRSSILTGSRPGRPSFARSPDLGR